MLSIHGPRLDPNADPDADRVPRPEEELTVLDPLEAGDEETELDDVAVGAPSGQQTSDRATGITAFP